MRRLSERASKQILIFSHFGTSKTPPGESNVHLLTDVRNENALALFSSLFFKKLRQLSVFL